MIYTHGGDVYDSQIDIDFSVNVNPLGMPKAVIDGAKRGVELSCQYPDYMSRELKKAIGRAENVKAEYLITGNGAAELIYALSYALDVKKALVTAPSFSEYELAVKSAGGNTEKYPLFTENCFNIRHDITEYIKSDTDIIFICNPNNPAGSITDRDVLLEIADICKKNGSYLCIDECFLPFVEKEEKYTLKPFINKYKNIIILRAYTKIYAMAGLRLGYLMCSDDSLREKIGEKIQPWNTSMPAQMAGTAAAEEKEYIQKTIRLINKERKFLSDNLSSLGFYVYPSYANFILFKADENLKDKLLEHKILIRSCDDFEGLGKSYFRIAVKTHRENEILVSVLKEVKEA